MASNKKPFDRATHMRKIATLGGQKTVQKHGSAHMRRIAKRRFNKKLK